MPRDNVTPNRMNKQKELGVTGLERWDGIINEEWIRELRDNQFYRTIREMRDNDPVIGAILFAIEMLMRQVEWRVDPASDEQSDLDNAEFLESCLDDMSHSWENFISEALSMLPYGYSYHEIVYKKRNGPTKNPQTRSKHTDGRIGWRKLPIRAQNTLDRWVFDDDGGVKAFIQDDPNTGFEYTIPIEKSLLFRTTSHKNNPEGRSVLRNAFRPWFFKKRIEEIEGIGIERDLAGLPVITAPPKIMSSNASSDEQALYSLLKDIVRNIRRDEQEGVIMPGGRDENGNLLYELKLLSTGGTRQFNTNEIINRYDQRIAMVVLADFILLGHEKTGSFALSSDKTSMFATAIGAWLDEIKSVMNTHAVPRLFKLNGIKADQLPQLSYGDIETPDLKALGEYIKSLTASGATLFPDDQLENHLRSAANLPEKTEEAE